MIAEIVFVLIAGLCFGSFVTMASHRLPRDEGIVFGPSHCPTCGARLGVLDLFPVLSWMRTKGKCRHCHAEVPWRYPAIEIACAAVFLLVYARYGLTANGIILMLAGMSLLIMIVADLENLIIPDEVHYALLPLAVLWHIPPWSGLRPVLLGLLLGLAFGLALKYGYRALRHKEGLGMGDVKFLAVAGAWTGAQNFIPFLFFAGVFGILTALLWRALGRGRKFPFGPGLAASLFGCLVFPSLSQEFWYLQAWVYR